MVKPPAWMQPEAVDDISKGGREKRRSFESGSFGLYMARKIEQQRQQFGLQLPPTPESAEEQTPVIEKKKRKRRKKHIFSRVIKKLKKRHGRHSCFKGDVLGIVHGEEEELDDGDIDQQNSCFEISLQHEKEEKRSEAKEDSAVTTDDTEKTATNLQKKKKFRPDLFFRGVVVLVNGFTNPDSDSLQRMLHQHGGDLEKYETARVTHIIAEHLSSAKADIYKKQRQPTPVCYPSWIVKSVQAGKLLPYGKYLIEEVRTGAAGPSVASYFQPKNDTEAALPKSTGTTVESPRVFPLVQSKQPPASDGDLYVNAQGKEVSNTASPNRKRSESLTKSSRPSTVGTDPNFLDNFFSKSRLSFIGRYQQRAKKPSSPTTKSALLSQSSPKQRYVFHIDMDSFFVSVALRKFPQYRDRPVVISHHGSKQNGEPTIHGNTIKATSTSECATCNYKAREFGIQKGMYLGRAKQLCPDLVVLNYDFEGNEAVTEKVMEILSHMADSHKNAVVEQKSCDEAFLELFLPAEGSDNKMLLQTMANDVRTEIVQATDCTATVGVATNKLLAKLASEKVKPNGSLVVIEERQQREILLRDLALREIHGIGRRHAQTLAKEGLQTVSQVWELGNRRAEDILCRVLGPNLGKRIYQFCNGIDDRPCEPVQRKSIGAEVSLLIFTVSRVYSCLLFT